MNFREAQAQDAAQIVEIVNGAYRGETGKQGWTTEAHLLGGARTDVARVNALMIPGQSVVLVAETLGQVIGCVHLEKKNSDTAYLGMLTVDVQRQTGGLGSKLLAAGEAFSRDTWKMKIVEMTVITVREELIAWYERRGYKKTGERRPFPQDPRFGIPLSGPLEFDVLVKNI